MTTIPQIRFAPAVQSMVDFIEPYRTWVEQCVGTSFSDTVTFELETPLAQTVVGRFLTGVRLDQQSNGTKACAELIRDWKVPPNISPRIALSHSRDADSLLLKPSSAWGAEWRECPIALFLQGLTNAIVAVNVPYVSFSSGFTSDWHSWIIVHKAEAIAALNLLDRIVSERQSELQVFGGNARPLPRDAYDWDALVLDPDVARLVRRDFETFFEREAWFRQNKLPFHRGYLFYGPPGNGKTSVIRVMASHPAITAHTINLHDDDIDDGSLTMLFELAYDSAPSLVILEDIDRLFSRGKEDERIKVSLQRLLNCLDGVIVNDGVIVVGTANNPTVLDSAILRRPGRFDRVVAFKNPTLDLRLRYLRKLAPGVQESELSEAAADSGGFSFAQLRESYILAAQFAFDDGREITATDLVHAARMLRSENLAVKTSESTAGVGFKPALDDDSLKADRVATVQRT